MRTAQIIRFISSILIVIFLLCFVFAFFWCLWGSFETVPTDEQQEKTQIAAIFLMIVNGILCGACIAVRRVCKRKC